MKIDHSSPQPTFHASNDAFSEIRAICSPWLTPPESARYCKMSLSLFNQKRCVVPIKRVGGTERRPRFHIRELDTWMLELYAVETKKPDMNEESTAAETVELHPLNSGSRKYRPRLLD